MRKKASAFQYYFLLFSFIAGMVAFYISSQEFFYQGYIGKGTFYIKDARDEMIDISQYLSLSSSYSLKRSEYLLGRYGKEKNPCAASQGYPLWTTQDPSFEGCLLNGEESKKSFFLYYSSSLDSFIDRFNKRSASLIPPIQRETIVLDNGQLTAKLSSEVNIPMGHGSLLPQKPSLLTAIFTKEEKIESIDAKKINDFLTKKNSPLSGVGECILDAEKRSTIPSITILSVAIHESNYGRSGLAQKSKNLFGFKCPKSGSYPSCSFSDKKECCKVWSKTTLDMTYEPNAPNAYRAYKDFCESINDFADLISKTERYKKAMSKKDDPTEMIAEIGRAGYATDPNWARGVSSIAQVAKTQIDQVQTG